MDAIFFQEFIAPYLLGVSQNALVGAVTAWGQQRDTNREQAERAVENERERLKPLIQRIEQKLLETLASLPADEEAARLLAREVDDPVFLRLLANQISLCRLEAEPFMDRWISERPDLGAQRPMLAPFIQHFLDALASAIASDTEISRRIQMQMLARLDTRAERMEAALLPPTAVGPQPMAIPALEQLQQACATASQALLAWPTSIDGERMESPAFAQLVEARQPEQSNVQLLLGEPGSGKSALFALLGRWFLERGASVLAIKADLLPQSVDSVAKLGSHLGLGEMPSVALRHLAQTAPAVVLVDQLDALADLVDVHGGRLNALLQFIRELAGVENVRVIASSREVEHRHDARLAAIEAEPVQLPLPEWGEVLALLERRGVPAKDWPEAFREILRRPQQLAIFVKLVSSGEEMPVFTSYQQMLERLWGQCVTNAAGLPGRADLLRDLARRMAAEETLWLARSRFDDRAPQVEQLIAAGILTTAEDERRLGFQHQTVFDFALARSFAAEGQTLTDFVLARQQSLFVRPRLWSALVYLRGAEPHTYRREFAALWQRQDLRYHVRLQLVEFLGQLEDPDHREEDYLRAALADPASRQTGLIAIVGRRAWFERLSPDVLPRLMGEGNSLGAALTEVLSVAAKQNAQTVLVLLRDHWISRADMDWWTASVLTNIQPWTADATHLAEILAGRDSTSVSRLFDVISFAAETDAALAVPIFAAFMRRIVAEVEALSGAIETNGDASPEARLFRDSPRQRAANNALQGNTDWPDLKPIAESAPGAFIENIWPLFLRLLAAMDEKDDATDNAFRREYGLGLSVRDGTAPLLEAIEIAAESLARTDSEQFADFLETAGQLNSMTVQRVLARGLAGAAARQPSLTLGFLLSDRRRFKLGDYNGEHRDSGALISSVCPHLNREQVQALEQAIAGWEPLRVARPDIEPERLERWTRKGRLRLLRYIPDELRSPEIAAFIAAEETTFPDLSQEDGISMSPMREIGSPMSPETMEQASDEEILATLAELPDSTEWENPRDFFQGGSIQVSRAFAELAKRQPERAFALISRLDPAEHTRPAAYALEKLAESEVPSEQLFAFVRALNARGFRNVEFRVGAADAVRKRLKTGEPIADDLFAMFEQWLPEIVAETVRDESEENAREEERTTTLLWQSGYSWTVPHGTYAVLSVLDAACRVARQPDRFLALVQAHLKRPERVATWRALCWHLDLLGYADRRASSAFLEELFQRFPRVRDSVAGYRAIAEAFRWLPPESVRSILESVRASEWSSSARGFGELLMYRHVFWDDEWAAVTITHLLADPATSQDVLTGLATTAAHAFTEPSVRSKAVRVLEGVIPRANEATAVEALGLFSLMPRLDPNPELLGVLNTFLGHPNALVSHALGPLVERLPDFIPTHSALAADLADTILDRHGQTLLDMRTSFAASASELINLALTLHRDEGVGRERGLTLFERLLALNVAGTRQSLLAVDARPVAGAPFRFRRRTRRVPRGRRR
ncbi:MAG: ATP-binding protein [Chthoniobacter sp.]